MDNYRTRLLPFIEGTVFLMASFGGILTGIAPPDASSSYDLGIASLGVFIALLAIAAVARSIPGRRFHRRWTIAGIGVALGIFVPTVFAYREALDRHTFWYPQQNGRLHVRGGDADLTPEAREFIKANPDQRAPQRLARNFELDQIWTVEAIDSTRTKLRILYDVLVLSLATSVFCLLEAIGGRPHNRADASAGRATKQFHPFKNM